MGVSPEGQGSAAWLIRMLTMPLTWAMVALVQLYRYTLGSMIPPSCRFEPSCSSYALEALRRHGPLAGGYLVAWRLVRCNPWGGAGYDPVPEKLFESSACGHARAPAGGKPAGLKDRRRIQC